MADRFVIQNAEREMAVSCAVLAYRLIKRGADASSVMNQLLSLAGFKEVFTDPAALEKFRSRQE